MTVILGQKCDKIRRTNSKIFDSIKKSQSHYRPEQALMVQEG
jgi:hypothetical protein